MDWIARLREIKTTLFAKFIERVLIVSFDRLHKMDRQWLTLYTKRTSLPKFSEDNFSLQLILATPV